MDRCKDSIIRLKEVQRRTGLPRSSIYEKGSRKTFPKPIKLGERAAGWYLSDVENWIANPR